MSTVTPEQIRAAARELVHGTAEHWADPETGRTYDRARLAALVLDARRTGTPISVADWAACRVVTAAELVAAIDAIAA